MYLVTYGEAMRLKSLDPRAQLIKLGSFNMGAAMMFLAFVVLEVTSVFLACSIILTYQGLNEKKGVLAVFKENVVRVLIFTVIMVVVKYGVQTASIKLYLMFR